MRDLRQVTGEHCEALSKVMHSGYRFATIYLEFLDILSPVSAGEETFLEVLRIHTNAIIAAEKMEGAQEATAKLRRGITDAIGRITTVLNDSAFLRVRISFRSSWITFRQEGSR